MPAPEHEMTAEVIDGILHERHGDDPWVYFSELREKTGAGRARTIDAYAMHVWPSKFRAVAYEIKTSRSDFTAEIKDPSKRAPFLENSTEFYFVVPHGLIEPEEVPRPCGLMYAQSGSEEARVIRKKLAAQRNIESFDPLFVASLLREAGRAYEGVDLFHLAGEALTHEDLQDHIDQAAKDRHSDYEFRQKMKEAAREELEDEYEEALEVQRWLVQHASALGISSFRPDADDLDEWYRDLDDLGGDTRDTIQRKVERAMRALTKISETLSE